MEMARIYELVYCFILVLIPLCGNGYFLSPSRSMFVIKKASRLRDREVLLNLNLNFSSNPLDKKYTYGDFNISLPSRDNIIKILNFGSSKVLSTFNDIFKNAVNLLASDKMNTSSSSSSSRQNHGLNKGRNKTLEVSKTFLYKNDTDYLVNYVLSNVSSRFDAHKVLQSPVIEVLVNAILCDKNHSSSLTQLSLMSLHKLLVLDQHHLVKKLIGDGRFLEKLLEFIEMPLQSKPWYIFSFGIKKSQDNLNREAECAFTALSIIHWATQSSDFASNILKNHTKLSQILKRILNRREWETKIGGIFLNETSEVILKKLSENNEKSNFLISKHNDTLLSDYPYLSTTQMAKVISTGTGNIQWKPKCKGHRGVRILSFDGGGTRGILSLAYINEIMSRVNNNLLTHEMFDIVCGTSTGGILAILLGAEGMSINSTAVLYDKLIERIFSRRSNLRLFTEQAAYDEKEFERILYQVCENQTLLDTNQQTSANVFCVSSKIDGNPPSVSLWRNYDYPLSQKSKYPGTCRVNTFTAIRATTAAPTFFKPVHWRGGLYSDGALVANNPTAIAIQEAKALYPGVPIEFVVSIGTGYNVKKHKIKSLGWDYLMNQIISSSTDTEIVHSYLSDLLPNDVYYRFNPLLKDSFAIDEKSPEELERMKRIARENVREIESGEEKSKFFDLILKLKGLY